MRRVISIIAVAALLFSQLALAAYACPMAWPASAAASSPAHGDCCDGPVNSPLCGAHCAPEAQAQKAAQPLPAAPPASPVLASRPDFFVVMRFAPATTPTAYAAPPPGPEPAIRNSRLRI